MDGLDGEDNSVIVDAGSFHKTQMMTGEPSIASDSGILNCTVQPGTDSQLPRPVVSHNARLQRGDMRRFRIWVLATVLFGVTFIGGQIFEFTEFSREGLNIDTSLFGSSFFVLTGFHGAHVSGGVIWLLILVSLAWRGQLDRRDSTKVEIAGLYWHFVDIVWIAIFTVIYLIP